MPRFKLAMFDFDGTMADSAESVVYCFQKTFESYGQPIPSEQEIRRTIGMSLKVSFDVLRQVGPDADSQLWVERYREILRRDGLFKCRMYPGADEMLAKLAASGVSIAVVSHRKAEFINQLLDWFGVGQTVSLVVGGDPEPYIKPDPRVYEKLVKPHFNGLGPDDCLMIGDTIYDLEFAANAGLKSCWASYGFGNPEECLAQKPDYQADCIADIQKLFD